MHEIEFSLKIKKIICIHKVSVILPVLFWNTPWTESTFDLNIHKSLTCTIQHRDMPVSRKPVLMNMSSKAIKNCFNTKGTVIRNFYSFNLTYEVLKQRPEISACTALKMKQEKTDILQSCSQMRNVWNVSFSISEGEHRLSRHDTDL